MTINQLNAKELIDNYHQKQEELGYEAHWPASNKSLPLDVNIIPGNNIKVKLCHMHRIM